jgi:hypothetical protein
MRASEINGLAGFLDSMNARFYENALVTNFLFVPQCDLVLQICAGRQISWWDGMTFVMALSRVSGLGALMGEVVQFIPKRDLERMRLIREARAIYERIFPQEDTASLQSKDSFQDE